MARIRTIKPEFWTDSKTGKLSEFGKCLFIGLLNHSDDYGILQWDPDEWRVRIFPYHSDTTTGAVKTALVGELLPCGLIQCFSYMADGTERAIQYVWITHFERHQVVNKRSGPLLAGWKIEDTPATYADRIGALYQSVAGLDDGSAPVVLREHSSLERKGKERNGKEEETPRRIAATRASALPSDFGLTDTRKTYATGKLPNVDPDELLAAFVDYHTAKGTVARDWDATWRTYVRNGLKFGYPMLAIRPDETKPITRYDARGRVIQ